VKGDPETVIEPISSRGRFGRTCRASSLAAEHDDALQEEIWKEALAAVRGDTALDQARVELPERMA